MWKRKSIERKAKRSKRKMSRKRNPWKTMAEFREGWKQSAP